MANVTIQVQSLLNAATYDSYTVDDSTTVANLKVAIQSATNVDPAWYSLFAQNQTLTESNTLASYGITTGTQIRSANKIGHLSTQQARQVAKLDLAHLRRYAAGDNTKNYYRAGNVYDLTSLPDTYNGNVPGIDDNPNTGGLIVGRPWVATSLITAPETLQDALPPSTLVELESWYDADRGDLFVPNNPSDGATFTQWVDGSSYAHNANPIGGATTRASYQTNELNTMSVVRFDGNDGLSINPYASLASAPALTIITVFKMTSTTGNPVVFSTNSGATALTYDSTAGKFVAKAAGGVGVSTVTNDAAFHIHSWVFDGTQTTNATSLKYRYDKSDITLTFTGTVGDTLSASNSILYIGNNNGANFYTGDMAEFLVFTKALTSTQVQNVENYLSTKWGL